MPILPTTFNDGDVLYAAQMEVIRDFLENSLAFRATAAGQILQSTGAGNMAGNNTSVLQIPQTGVGVLQFTNGVPSLAALVAGVLTSDTNPFPEAKLPVHSWVLSSSAAQIPNAFIPALGGFALNELGSANSSTVNINWSDTGIVLGGHPLEIGNEPDDDLGPTIAVRVLTSPTASVRSRNPIRMYLSQDIADADAVTIGSSVGTGNLPFGSYDVTVVAGTAQTPSQLFLGRYVHGTAPNQETRLAIAVNVLNLDPMPITVWKVDPAQTLQYPAASEAEALAGTSRDFKSWSPHLVRLLAERFTVDETARTSAATAIADAAAAVVTAAAAQAAAIAAVQPADLNSLLEPFSVPSDPATIPTSRYGDDTVAEQKLTPQVREKLNVRAAGGVAKRHVLLDKGLLRNGTSFETTLPTLTFPSGFDSLDDFEFVYWEVTVEQGSDRGQNSQTVTNTTSEDANWPYPINFFVARESETATLDFNFWRLVLDLDRDGSYRIASQNLGTNNARVELTISALKLA